jgi:SIR2-like protein
MRAALEFTSALESKITEQLQSQRVGYLLGAGSSYLNGNGYPLSFELWDKIKNHISDVEKRDEIQRKIDFPGTKGIEHALDLLDGGGPEEGDHRHLVAKAIADLFLPLAPPLDSHVEFVRRLAAKSVPHLKVFNLNYDPLIERAAELGKVRLYDGFAGHEHAYFDAATFEERIFRVRGTHKGRQPDETAKPLHLLKLHGSLGWYHCDTHGVRRCGFGVSIPDNTKRLMIPPQRRKADDTMTQPYQALWSAFRGALGQDHNPLHRLACIGYGFADEHVNTVIESALARTDFTVLIFTKDLSDEAWNRWSAKSNVIIVTEDRCAIKSEVGAGHPDLWKFEHLSKRI